MSEDDIRSTIEIERKYEVDSSTAVPRIPGLRSVSSTGSELLHAIYYDTPAGHLAANSITLRLRVGGHDDGWHLKMPLHGERVEHQTAVSNDPPPRLLALVNEITDETPVAIAIVDTRRSTTHLTDGEGNPLAEVDDDEVSTVDLQTGIRRSWREWEVELINGESPLPDGSGALLIRIERALLAVGAEPSRYVSKLARALGRTELA